MATAPAELEHTDRFLVQQIFKPIANEYRISVPTPGSTDEGRPVLFVKQKKLKVFRLEAIRTGFRWAWQQNDYNAILDVAEKIPEDVLQEDAMLLMWYTNSLIRTGRGA